VSTFLKVTLALLLTLPLGAYIAGTLVASQTDMPPTRVPVVLEGSPSESVLPTPSRTPRPSPSSDPTRNRDDPGDDDHDSRGDDDGRKDGDGDDEVRVIRPTPRDVDDPDDDSLGGDDDGSDDDSEGDDDS